MYSDSFSCFKLKEQLFQLQQMGQTSLEKNLVMPANSQTRQLDKFTAAMAQQRAACVTLGKPSDVVLQRLSIQNSSWSYWQAQGLSTYENETLSLHHLSFWYHTRVKWISCVDLRESDQALTYRVQFEFKGFHFSYDDRSPVQKEVS